MHGKHYHTSNTRQVKSLLGEQHHIDDDRHEGDDQRANQTLKVHYVSLSGESQPPRAAATETM